MELSDQLKKELKKYCLLLHAYSDTSWTIPLWFEADDDHIDRFDNKIVFHNHRTNQKMDVPPIIENFLEDLRSNLNFDEIYEIWPGENYCRGYLIFKFEPEDELFELVIDFEVEKVDDYTFNNEIDDFELTEENKTYIDNAIENNVVSYVTFDGGGDSGYIESVDSEDREVPKFILDILYEILEHNIGAWETNEGSMGEFKIDYEWNTIFTKISVFGSEFQERNYKEFDLN